MQFAEIKRVAGGRLRSPDTLYDTITGSTFNKIGSAFPASKGEVQASTSVLQAELNEDKAFINVLVNKVNALTPVGCRII